MVWDIPVERWGRSSLEEKKMEAMHHLVGFAYYVVGKKLFGLTLFLWESPLLFINGVDIMSCCNNVQDANIAAINDARSRLTDPLAGSSNAVYRTVNRQNECITPVRGCAQTCDCEPIPVEPLCPREYRLCTDQNGCATRYPADCRNLYWPNFAHPRWLPCNCLYCTCKCCCCPEGR